MTNNGTPKLTETWGTKITFELKQRADLHLTPQDRSEIHSAVRDLIAEKIHVRKTMSKFNPSEYTDDKLTAEEKETMGLEE